MSLQPARILVAEDDEAIRLLLAAILARAGYAADFARNGEEAITRLSGERYDAILLDLMMPVASGFDVLRYMDAAYPEKASQCVIVLTAASNQDLRGVAEGQVFRLIRKPFEMKELIRAIDECVQRDSATQKPSEHAIG
ncbi:MAG: response regulator [Acidobacteriota bacterium]